MASQLPVLSDAEFDRIRQLIYQLAGISLGPSKRHLVAGRLARRLRDRQLTTFAEYLATIARLAPSDPEIVALVNCLTTNKTSLYREAHHFTYLRETLAPLWIERARQGGPQQVRIWSAGCSKGDEPYTIAMALHDVLPPAQGWDVRILATDIDTEILRQASAARYEASDLDEVPTSARACFQRTTHGYEVRRDIRTQVQFRQLNLNGTSWPVHGPFDAIFCRNVVIYFDKPTQSRLFDRFAGLLGAEGRLFIGHSESLTNVCDRFTLDGQTVYRLRDGARRPAAAVAGKPASKLETVVLGDVRATASPTEYATFLGSCVSVCMFDPVARVGGMNHFRLPDGGDAEPGSPRYGETAMAQLVGKLIALGAERHRLQAKVFGANHVGAGAGPIATDNARFVRSYLASASIPVVVDKLGRDRPLELHFLPHDGTVKFRDIRELPRDQACHASS